MNLGPWAVYSWLLAMSACLCFCQVSFWRLPCNSVSEMGRLDPIMSPGRASEHVHVIFGAKNFAYDTTYAQLAASTCTSYSVVEDKSAYWAPALCFTPDNRTCTMVPRRDNLVVYYYMNQSAQVTFPEGFRMVSGDSKRRSISIPVSDPITSHDKSQHAIRQRAIGFNCLGTTPPEGAFERHMLPNKDFIDRDCQGGLRFELMFLSCWNGALDSDDHKSHVAFPDEVMHGECPPGFELRLPALQYEMVWDTTAYAQTPGHYVLANGDYTGLGYHDDFISGWDSDLLRRAGSVYADPVGNVKNCGVFTFRDEVCLFDIPGEIRNEDVLGPRLGLPAGRNISSWQLPKLRRYQI